MMKYLLLLLVFCAQSMFAQEQESSDPDAVNLLERIKLDYDNRTDHQIEFELNVEYPGESPQLISGSLLQSGEMFSLDLGDKLVVSDNITVWLYLKERNEVQINDADFGDDGEYMSPNKIFNLYNSDEFIFAISNRSYENSVAITQIECKPRDPNSEYAKMRLTLEDKGNRVKRFKIFSKDGSRFTMTIKSHSMDLDLDKSTFTFDADIYDNIIVEDLRF